MNKDKCNAGCRVSDGDFTIWKFCELDPGHIGRHQRLEKQSTRDRNWVVVLWDADERPERK